MGITQSGGWQCSRDWADWVVPECLISMCPSLRKTGRFPLDDLYTPVPFQEDQPLLPTHVEPDPLCHPPPPPPPKLSSPERCRGSCFGGRNPSNSLIKPLPHSQVPLQPTHQNRRHIKRPGDLLTGLIATKSHLQWKQEGHGRNGEESANSRKENGAWLKSVH